MNPKELAQEAIQYLQNACGDVAYQITEDFESDPEQATMFHPEFAKWHKKAKKMGVSDFCGAYADYLYNDVETLTDLLGDYTYDLAQCNREIQRLTLIEIRRAEVHTALESAVNDLIMRVAGLSLVH